MEMNLQELHQVFLNMAVLVQAQGAADLERHELQSDPDRRVGFHGGFPEGPITGNHPEMGSPVVIFLGWDFGVFDDLGAEDILIFDLKLEVSHGISQRDKEMLVPLRILGVPHGMCPGDMPLHFSPQSRQAHQKMPHDFVGTKRLHFPV
ncbi:hypothetical protein ACFX13_020276 [Malus domestica]